MFFCYLPIDCIYEWTNKCLLFFLTDILMNFFFSRPLMLRVQFFSTLQAFFLYGSENKKSTLYYPIWYHLYFVTKMKLEKSNWGYWMSELVDVLKPLGIPFESNYKKKEEIWLKYKSWNAFYSTFFYYEKKVSKEVRTKSDTVECRLLALYFRNRQRKLLYDTAMSTKPRLYVLQKLRIKKYLQIILIRCSQLKQKRWLIFI